MKAGFGTPDTGNGKGKISKHITHGFHLMKGKSAQPMEDYLVSEFKQEKDRELGLFAIFDGHLGHDVASYLQNHLFQNILQQVRLLSYFIYNFVFGPIFMKIVMDKIEIHFFRCCHVGLVFDQN